MQIRSGGGAWDRKSNRKHKLLGGVCVAALAFGLTAPAARAANFEASNETELYQAIADAQASSDAASTITLTSSFQITSPPPAIIGKAITIETGANTLSYDSGALFDIASGASLTISGQIQGTGVLNTGPLGKVGEGDLILDGATGTGITRIGLDGGHTLVTGGSEITFGTSVGTVSQLDIAGDPGQVASLTISGEGTRLTATGSDNTDLSQGTGTRSTLTVEGGAAYVALDSNLRVHTPSSGGTATINVLGQGSLLNVEGFGSYGGTSTFNVLDGGVIDITNSTNFGGVGNNANAGANVTAIVSGQGSRWDTGTLFYMHNGSLSILDGGVVTAATVNIGTTTSLTVATDFDVLVSGAGSELSATAINLGTRRTGTLTIADGGRVVVNGGASALVVGGAFANSDATLNIGGAAGEAAAAAGTLEASAVTLAASADVNFNHTETGYVFDIPINGSGAINQIAGHTIFADQTGFTGLTSVYGGMLEVNGVLGGIMDVRGGTLAGIGTVGDTQNFAGGTIAPGNSIGTLTVDGNYTSNGGALEIETDFGDPSFPTDLLVITGDSILGTGATRVFVTNVGSGGLATTGDGIKIVDVAGASDADAFALGAPAIGGAYLYGLFQNGIADPADGDWYLRMTDTLAPTVPVYENYPIVLLGLAELPTLQQRVGDRYWPGADEDASTYPGPRNLWTRIDGAHRHVEGDSTSGAAYDSDRFLVQAGIDGLLAENASGMLIGGFNAQYGRVNADIESDLGNGDNSTDSYGVGATLTWYGNDGIYVDGQASVARLSSELSADATGELADGNDGVGYAFSIEAGRKLPVGGNWSVTPQAQLAYTSVDFDDFTDPFGASVSLDDGDSLKGRIGMALDYDAGAGSDRSHVYGIANLTYEFLDGTAVDVAGTKVAFEPDSFGAELGLGGTYRWAGGKYALYGEALASTSFEGSYGFRGTLGFSTAF